MAELPAPFLTICIGLPMLAAAAVWKMGSEGRNLAIGAMSATLLLLLEVLRRVVAIGGGALAEPWELPLFGSPGAWLMADGLNAAPMALFGGVAFVTLIAAPRRDMDRRFLVGLLVLASSTLAVYAAANLLVFVTGWIVAVAPFAVRAARKGGHRGPAIVLAAGALFLTIAAVLIGVAGVRAGVAEPLSIAALHGGSGAGGPLALGLLVFAVILREGIFPFHRYTVALFDRSPMSTAALLVNSHLGAFLLARVVMPSFPVLAAEALPWLGGLALWTALYTAVLGTVEREPRRVLAMLILSQSSALVAGLSSASHEGIAGALTQWIVLSISFTIVIVVYRGIEARLDLPFAGGGFFGLAASLPRMAVFFALGGLAMVGLPGTLGFPGEDLLLHGVLAGFPGWGVVLPVAIALNAYQIFRLFARLFLGKDGITRNTLLDALPRERLALSSCLILLVLGGIIPSAVIHLQAPAVGALVQVSNSSSGSGPGRHR